VIFLAKRRMDSVHDQFKCHGFETSSNNTAKQLAAHIVATCNSVFRKLRRTRKRIREHTEKRGKEAPKTYSVGEASTEEADRLRRELQAEVEAAKEYRESLQLALSDLDGAEEADDDDESPLGNNINYEEFADEFAAISLEIAEQVAKSGERYVALVFEQNFALEDAIGIHDVARVESRPYVRPNRLPLAQVPTLLPRPS
jgi:hypothetical protein